MSLGGASQKNRACWAVLRLGGGPVVRDCQFAITCIAGAIMLGLGRHLGLHRQLLLAAEGFPAAGSLLDALQQHWQASGCRGAYNGARSPRTPQVPSAADAEAAADEDDSGSFVTLPASLDAIGALNPQLRDVILQHQSLQK